MRTLLGWEKEGNERRFCGESGRGKSEMGL